MRYLATLRGSEMDHTDLPFWLQGASWDLRFAEDDDDNSGDGEDDDADDEDDSEEDEEDPPKGKGKKKDDDREDTAGLKSALQKERADRKKLEREAKALRKFKETEEAKGKSDTEKATDEARKSAEKADRLAKKLLTNEVNTTIIKLAGKLGFADVDDAIGLVKRSEITVEQDEDDPSEVEVDSESVEKALKALLKKKPHLAAKSKDEDDEDDDEDDDDPPARRRTSTGSKAGSRGTRDKGKIKEAELIERYPALRR